MREWFQKPRRGQVISAAYLERLMSVIRTGAAGGAGSHASQSHSTAGKGVALDMPFVQENLIVSVVDNVTYLHTCQIRNYNQSAGAWQTDSDSYTLDGTNTEMDMEVGDKLIGFWDVNRNAFVSAM